MKEYIEREALLKDIEEMLNTAQQHINITGRGLGKTLWTGIYKGINFCQTKLLAVPAADVVSKELYEQIKWERDVALAQLEEYGVSLGEKADVVEVRHGRWESTGALVGLMNFEYFYRCTACGRRGGDTKTNYCPHCGALMDKEE